MRKSFVPYRFLLVVILLVSLLSPAAIAEDKADTKKADTKQTKEQAMEHLLLMRGLVDSWKTQVQIVPGIDPELLKFEKDPVHRYHDPHYKLFDCTVWRLGKKGRPHAYVSVELVRPKEKYLGATFEFLSVSGVPLTISGESVTWKPHNTPLTFLKLKTDEKPVDSPDERLMQMKKIISRFSAEELVGRKKIDLTMLPEPIDRYQPTSAKNSDAAVFVYGIGVNPEVLLFLETDGQEWSFTGGRLCAAQVSIKLDGQEVWKNPKISSRPKPGQISYSSMNGYTASGRSVKLPIAP